MGAFIIQFLLCNLFLSMITLMLLAAKRLLIKRLTNRAQYNLWFLLLGLLAAPFLPIQPSQFPNILSWLGSFQYMPASHARNAIEESRAPFAPGAAAWMDDIGIAVGNGAPFGIGLFLFALWIVGVLGMSALAFRSAIRFRMVKKSSLPVQSLAVQKLYQGCLDEMNQARAIPIRSTVFLTSPVIAGVFRPCIYLPTHLISDYNASALRHMLLHELQHHKHKDALVHFFMNVASILYWFNPFVQYAMKEMKNDGEIACDASVLKMLEEGAYKDYGNTLINLAEKVSRCPFPFTAGIGGDMAQMKKRILHIAAYRPASTLKKIHSFLAYAAIGTLLSGFLPLLCIQAAGQDHYNFQERGRDIAYLDLSSQFGANQGSFVLYDEAKGLWQIYNKDYATTRIAPVSTYKIYSALFGLKEGIITPEQSLLPWDGQRYGRSLWNSPQTLESAMQNSVTWYFQAIDQQSDLHSIREYVREIGYGNQTVSGDISSYWGDSSLKISPVEQVEMLQKFSRNDFHFSPEHIETVKNAICLYSDGAFALYGKTGTAEVNGKNTSGWFVGYLESNGNTYFFATNVQNNDFATGAAATELTFSILSGLGLWDAPL